MTCKKACGGCSPETEPVMESFDGISALLEIAASGFRAANVFRRFVFKDAALAALAKKIADMTIENRYLRDLVDFHDGLLAVFRADVKKASVSFSFGPRQQYNLQIPLLSPRDRVTVAAQLRAAADELTKHTRPVTAYLPEQQAFPFLDADE